MNVFIFANTSVLGLIRWNSTQLLPLTPLSLLSLQPIARTRVHCSITDKMQTHFFFVSFVCKTGFTRRPRHHHRHEPSLLVLGPAVMCTALFSLLLLFRFTFSMFLFASLLHSFFKCIHHMVLLQCVRYGGKKKSRLHYIFVCACKFLLGRKKIKGRKTPLENSWKSRSEKFTPPPTQTC